MKHSAYLISSVLLISTCLSCDIRWRSGDYVYNPEIVVDGWIEEGEAANVILTQTVMVNPDIEQGEIKLQDIPIKWAKVTVSDGEQEEVLVGRKSDGIFPPYRYTGVSIRGEAGKKYFLKVEYSGRTVTAETTIPEPVRIDDFKVVKSEECDTLYRIDISFMDDRTEKNWYKVLTSIRDESTDREDMRYYSAFMGTVSDEILGPEENTITVSRPFRHIRTEDYSPYFHKGETVKVKLAQIDEASFLFWSDYENEISNGKNILFPSTWECKLNLTQFSLHSRILRDYVCISFNGKFRTSC